MLSLTVGHTGVLKPCYNIRLYFRLINLLQLFSYFNLKVRFYRLGQSLCLMKSIISFYVDTSIYNWYGRK